MGEHRSRIGAALLASVAVFVAAGATTAANNTAGWGNPIVIGLLVFALLCLVGSLIAFHPAPSGNAKMNRLIARQYRSFKRRRAIQRLFHVPKEQPLAVTVGLSPAAEQADIRAGRSIAAGGNIEASGTIEAGERIDAGENIRAGVPEHSPPPEAVVFEHGDALLKAINQAEFRYSRSPFPLVIEPELAQITAHVESWATDISGPALPKLGNGGPLTDLARLKVYVEKQMAIMRARQAMK